MYSRENTYYCRNLNNFLLEKAFYYMKELKDVIVWDTFAEF